MNSHSIDVLGYCSTRRRAEQVVATIARRSRSPRCPFDTLGGKKIISIDEALEKALKFGGRQRG